MELEEKVRRKRRDMLVEGRGVLLPSYVCVVPTRVKLSRPSTVISRVGPAWAIAEENLWPSLRFKEF